MDQQVFTLREAKDECARLGFKRSRIWWNKQAAAGIFHGRKMRINGRVFWTFTRDEINRILKLRPPIVIVFLIAILFSFPAFAEIGKASWYSSADACGVKTNNHPGCPTASGRGLFDLERDGVLFCASNDYPMHAKLKVTNLKNNQSVVCEVLDRGGFTKYGRKIDLGKQAFSQIANTREGVIRVQIERE